jgi:hypothetical protein
MPKYETIGGQVTRGETYAKIDHHLAEVEDLCAVMAHLHNTEGNHMDQLLAKGWLGTSGMFKKIRSQVQALAMGKLQ